MKSLVKYTARFGTGLLLMILIWSCARVPGLKEETSGTYIKIPFVRVLLEENKKEITAAADGSFAIECLIQGEQTIYYSSQPVKVKNNDNYLLLENHRGNIIQSHLDEINIIPRGNKNRTYLNQKRYRGILKVVPNGGNLNLINIVYLEDYLRGVVPPEIGNRNKNEMEAVKAQTIAARTYAMAHLQQYKNEPYDVKSSILDQIYEGVNVENKLINKAIDLTIGRVLFYQDNFVNAYYHSTCGGFTDDISSVWDRKEIPYLKAVKDDDACVWSKYYNWKEVFTEKQLRGRIEQYLSSDRGRDLRIGNIRDLTITSRTPGGRVAKLLVHTDNDIYKFQKDRIRWVIGRTSNPDLILPSDRFDIDIKRNQAGNLVSVTFKGSGYGHGVGMCQCGAIGLSRQGWSYDKILTHYYTDVEVKKLY
ncbi:MAG: SpoIID/LytB domain-containing protein [Candidatus Zixiibacteriota bacterium]